jgi:hypothetical protein
VVLLKKEEGITKYVYAAAVALGNKMCVPSFIIIGSYIQYQGYNFNNLIDCNIDMTDGRKV